MNTLAVKTNLPGRWEVFPNEIILQILLYVPVDQLGHICVTNKTIAGVCSDDTFWRERVRRDFKREHGLESVTWQKYYRILQSKRIVPLFIRAGDPSLEMHVANIILHRYMNFEEVAKVIVDLGREEEEAFVVVGKERPHFVRNQSDWNTVWKEGIMGIYVGKLVGIYSSYFVVMGKSNNLVYKISSFTEGGQFIFQLLCLFSMINVVFTKYTLPQLGFSFNICSEYPDRIMYPERLLRELVVEDMENNDSKVRKSLGNVLKKSGLEMQNGFYPTIYCYIE